MIDGRLTENYPERFLRCARGKNIQLQITHKTHNIPLWIHLINQVYSELGNSCLLYAHLVKATLFYTFLQKKERWKEDVKTPVRTQSTYHSPSLPERSWGAEGKSLLWTKPWPLGTGATDLTQLCLAFPLAEWGSFRSFTISVFSEAGMKML